MAFNPNIFSRPATPLKSSKGDDAPSSSDGKISFREGEVIFEQGSPGGDLYFIEEGTVEIFTSKGNEKIVLSEMSRGEIIGVMTCLTNDPRMAGARAKTEVTCKLVPHGNIQKVVEKLPNWLKIVLKEFSIRLSQSNKNYTDASVRIKQLESSQHSFVDAGAQLAAAFGGVGELIAIKSDVGRLIIVEDMLGRLETILNYRKEDLEKLYQVLVDSGLLKVEIDPERKKMIVKLENAQKLTHFAQFVRESKHGSTKKLVRARFTNKETRVVAGVVKLAARLGMDLDKLCKFNVKELERSLEKATGIRFDSEALEKAASFKLLAIEKTPEGDVVVTKPAHLGRTIACIEAVRKFQTLDHQGLGKDGESKKAS